MLWKMLSNKYAIYYLRINSNLMSPSCKEVGKNKPSGWKNNQMPSILTPAQPVTKTGPGEAGLCMVRRLSEKQNETHRKDVLQDALKIKTHADRSTVQPEETQTPRPLRGGWVKTTCRRDRHHHRPILQTCRFFPPE